MQGMPQQILNRLQARIPQNLTEQMIYMTGILKCGEYTYIRRYCKKHNYRVERISNGRFRIIPTIIKQATIEGGKN